MNMKSPHHQIAFSIVTSNANVLLDDEPLDSLIEDIASALQNAFDLGFKAAGGSIYPPAVIDRKTIESVIADFEIDNRELSYLEMEPEEFSRRMMEKIKAKPSATPAVGGEATQRAKNALSNIARTHGYSFHDVELNEAVRAVSRALAQPATPAVGEETGTLRKHPVAFIVKETASGDGCSVYLNEEHAARSAEIYGFGYQGLYLRDGTPLTFAHPASPLRETCIECGKCDPCGDDCPNYIAPVAWRWRPPGATLWIYDPTDEWRLAQGNDIETEPLYAAQPTSPLPASQ